jgi:hypothetical protein
MTGLIYLLNDEGELVGMEETPYASEDLLQQLLAKYPSLLAGDQIDSSRPRKWLLVTRELPILPLDGDTGNMWLDHLFLDQDAIPTLIEVKRSCDTRLRRKIVGQMLDYAANAVAYLPLETVQSKFVQTCEKDGVDPELCLLDFLEAAMEPDDFWQRVKVNLQAGKIRLLFVADIIPVELQRIIEFLNEQMDPAEVLAVEVKQFVGSGVKTLVPRVIGQTAEAQQKKSSGRPKGRKWDEISYFKDLAERKGEEQAKVAREIFDWASSRVTRVWFGEGTANGSFVPVLHHADRDHQLFAVYTSGSLEIYFQWYSKKEPFIEVEKRLDILNRLNAIEGIALPEDSIGRRPSIPLSDLTESARLKAVLEVFDWVIDEIKKS